MSFQQKLPQGLEQTQLVEQDSSLAHGVWMTPVSEAPLSAAIAAWSSDEHVFQMISFIRLQSGLAGWVAKASVSLG